MTPGPAPAPAPYERNTQSLKVFEERWEQLPLDAVIPSKTNPRNHFDARYLNELAESIREKGVIQPILVRPIEGDRYEIIAGERRYRASCLALQPTIPAIVRNYTDEQVLELQLIENLHRRDLAPLEEARGFRALIDSNPSKHSAESIAARIGMSPQWVWDRMKLMDLIPGAAKLLEAERISVGHAILIARQTPDVQEQIIDPNVEGFGGSRSPLWRDEHSLEFEDDGAARKKDKYHGLKPCSVRELDHWITDHVRFDASHAAAAQPFDFGATAETIENAAARPGRGRKVVAITHEYRVTDDARDQNERTYGSQSWERADGKEKSKTCEHSVLGVVKAGRGRGEVFEVCVARDRCKVHFAAEVKAREKRERERAKRNAMPALNTRSSSSTERQDREAEKRRAEEQLWNAMVPELRTRIAQHLKSQKFGAKLLGIVDKHMFPGYMDLSTVKDVEREFGVKLTDQTAAQVLALMTIDLNHEHGANVTLSPWGFSLEKFKTDYIKAHPPQTSGVVKGKKAAAKKKAAA